MFCPMHKYQEETLIGNCPNCEALNQVVIECEIDKIDRALSTMHEQGYYLGAPHDGTRAILVFKKDKE